MGRSPFPPAWPVTSAPVESGLQLGSAARPPPRGLGVHAASSARAASCFWGAPRRECEGGRYGRRRGRGPKARSAGRLPSRPVACYPSVARAASGPCAPSSPQPSGPACTHSWMGGANVSGSRPGWPGAHGSGQPARPRACEGVSQRRTVVRCTPHSWAMVRRWRPRLAIQTAWQRSRRRRSVVVVQGGASGACAVAVSRMRRLTSAARS
jgi:hypothetical protein